MRLLFSALLVTLLAGPSSAAPDPLVSVATYRSADGLVARFDRSGDGVLSASERTALEREVKKRFRERGVRILAALLTRADGNADGTLTRAEWSALGKSLGTTSGWIVRRTLMLPMSDGVRLATDVYVPEGKGPFPTLLWRTPYGRGGGPAAWVAAGYACVKQDMRGRFDSEGENLPFVGCGVAGPTDGVDTIAWIRKQPFSNGKIGTVGGSALGITQNLTAGAAPAGLVAQHISVAAASLYHDAAYVGGALRKSQVEGWLKGNRFDPKALRLYRAHPSYDAFWQTYDSTRHHEKIDVPGMHVGGWFDTFSAGTVASFRGRQEHGGPGAKGRQVLLMGPWAHGGFRNGGRVGGLVFPNAGTPDGYRTDQWLAHHLLGKDVGLAARGAVAYYVMGDAKRKGGPGNEWRFADAWPIPARETAFHLAPDGLLTRSVPATSVAEYEFDPALPCPTIGGCNLNLPSGPRDQKPIESRSDVLLFTTPPLEKPVEVTGHATAKLFVATSTPDADLSVRLCDVYPDGSSYLVAEGMLRLRHREGFEKPVPMVPGEITKVTVPLWPTSVVFDRGHRIRVTVTSSNDPRFDVNPGTGRPGLADGPMRKQTVRLHLGAGRLSRISLPVVPVGKR